VNHIKQAVFCLAKFLYSNPVNKPLLLVCYISKYVVPSTSTEMSNSGKMLIYYRYIHITHTIYMYAIIPVKILAIIKTNSHGSSVAANCKEIEEAIV